MPETVSRTFFPIFFFVNDLLILARKLNKDFLILVFMEIRNRAQSSRSLQ